MDPLYELALSVKAAQRGLERFMNEAMAPLGVTGAQADAIFVIGQAEPLSLKALGDLLIAEAGHPSRLVDRLVEGGYVKRRGATDDRRRIELSLTAKGRKLLVRIEAVREDVFRLARELIGDREVEPMLELLRDLLQHTPYAELVSRRRELAAEQ
jgi:DNA-binding MarR family transcriptional regulator